LGLYIGPAKDKLGLSFHKLIYEGFNGSDWRLVSGLGGGAYPCPAQGVGSADVSAGHRGIPDFLQAVAAAGHGGLGPEFHGGGGGAAAVEPVATGGLISRMRFSEFSSHHPENPGPIRIEPVKSGLPVMCINVAKSSRGANYATTQ